MSETPLLDEFEGPDRPMVKPAVIDRISINDKRYVASEDRAVLEGICEKKGINKKWIRYSERHGKYYLRLWGRWKGV